MRTIAHLSDLHFGRVDEALLQPLRTFLDSARPDLIVISGDLTQRAKAAQFIAARDFMDSLPARKIVVPGNHDVPLYDVFSRFFSPLKKYQRYITTDMEPAYDDGEMAVLGINTARSLTFKDGRINEEQLALVRAKFQGMDERVVKILVTHHPFDLPPDMGTQDLVGRAPMAMQQFADCGVDILLAGHMHTSEAVTTDRRYKTGNYSALAIQAGTATSTRARGETNSFNILRVSAGLVELDRVGWVAERGVFEKSGGQIFTATDKGWSCA